MEIRQKINWKKSDQVKEFWIRQSSKRLFREWTGEFQTKQGQDWAMYYALQFVFRGHEQS